MKQFFLHHLCGDTVCSIYADWVVILFEPLVGLTFPSPLGQKLKANQFVPIMEISADANGYAVPSVPCCIVYGKHGRR